MSEKSIEEFNKALEQYILGVGYKDLSTSSNEYDELLDIGKSLWDEDVCKDIDEEKLRGRFMKQLQEEKEHGEMKKGKSLKKVMMAASMVAILGGVMAQTTFGEEFITSIIAKFSTKNVTVLQLDEEKKEQQRQAIIEQRKSEPMPEEYKGKIFDASGNEFTYFPAYLEGAYNAKGEPIICVKDGQVFTEEEWKQYCEEEEEMEPYTEITDITKINDYTCFEVKMPTYLPEGISFEHAGVWSEETVTDNMCIEVEFADESGENVIYMQQRMACEEAGYETGTTDKIIEVDINGVKGLMYDDSLHWETKDAIYSITSMNEGVTREEMIKIAQSIK